MLFECIGSLVNIKKYCNIFICEGTVLCAQLFAKK